MINSFKKRLKNYDFSELKKKDLQEKFLTKLKETKSEGASSAGEETIIITKNKSNSNKEKSYKKEISELKERLKKSESKAAKYYKEKIESENVCLEIKDENTKLKTDIENISNLLKIDENKLTEIDVNNDLYSKLLSKNNNLKKSVSNLRKKVKYITKKKNLINNELDEAKNNITILTDKLNEANKQLIILNGMDSQPIDKIVSDCFKELDYYLSYSNIHIYSKNINDLTKRINNMKNNLTKLNTIDNNEENQPLFGIIVEHDEKIWFNSTEDDIYEIESFKGNIQIDCPAKAILLESGKVYIEAVYTEYMNYKVPSITEKSLKYAQSKKTALAAINNKIKKDKFIKFGDYTVLIIGKKNKEKYTKILENHGLKVLWHNPFLDSPKFLESKISNANIILVCKKYFHGNILKDYTGNNVSYIEQDSEKTIEVRTRFMIVNNFVS